MIAEVFHFFIESRKSWIQPRKPRTQTSIYEKEFCERYSSSQKTSDFEILNAFIHEKIKVNIPNQGKFLDVACGPGCLLLEMAKMYPEVSFYGIDASQEMLNIARRDLEREKVANIRLELGDMNQLSKYFQKQEFDFISWNFAAHYCASDEQFVSILNAISELLKPDGNFFFVDLVRFKLENTLDWFSNKYDLPVGMKFFNETRNSYLASFTPMELRNLIGQSLLKNLKCNWSPGFPVLFTADNLKIQPTSMIYQGRPWPQKMKYFLLRLVIACFR
ncbi:MAG: class I SAM-dependent methyltransferase [Deltaproteobacteria bacterium]|nr:class I SAM-dependent methyltransferase [Deltaproteobacteria bacterium]